MVNKDIEDMKILLGDKKGFINQVESINKNDFEQYYFSKQKPVIIVKGVSQWKSRIIMVT